MDEIQSEHSSEEELLKTFGITYEELQEADALNRTQVLRNPRDPRICLCGHAVSRHSITNGIVYCKPSAMGCPCKKVKPVIAVSDTRKFLRKSRGGGRQHALMLGVAALLATDEQVLDQNRAPARDAEGRLVRRAKTAGTLEWLEPPACELCKRTDVGVMPYLVTKSGFATDEPTGFDALLCLECRATI